MWRKAQAQAKFLTAAATMRFLIARPPSRGANYYVTSGDNAARRRGSATGVLDEDDDEEEEENVCHEPPSPLLLLAAAGGGLGGDPTGESLPPNESCEVGGSSPRSRDSGNMSIDSDDKSFEIQRNRLSSSSSSKDGSGGGGGGHRSDSIDRSTTNSSKSEASSHDGSTTRSDPGKPEFGIAVGSSDMKKSQSLFSIDSDFMFVSTKHNDPQTIMIRPGGHNQPMLIRKDCLVNHININNNNHHSMGVGGSGNSVTIIDPIYEIIHEHSEPEADMYCLPVDSVTSSAAAKSVLSGKMVASPEHVAKKTRSRSSDQVKLLAKSTSGKFS